MVYEVRRSVACRLDLDRIVDHLVMAHMRLGEDADGALRRAASRIDAIEDAIDALGRAPHQGTLWPALMGDLRWVAKGGAVMYFIVDDEDRRMDVLAVFYGGEDHKRHMLDRILSS